MSVNKDVENMYRKDAEKRKKNQKKKKKNKLITLIIVILMIAGILFLLNYLGFGFGLGKGEGGGENTESQDKSVSVEDAAVSQEESTQSLEESSEEESQAETFVMQFVDITAAGSAYIYNGNVTELEAFIDTVGKMNDNVVVRIIDDNATQNAMEDLQNALDENDRKFVINAQADLTVSDTQQEFSEVVP